jgi:hypothetical protein
MSTFTEEPARLVPAPGRRRQPRTEIIGELHGYSLRLERAVVIREVSVEGFSARTPAPFTPGSTESFQFTAADGHSTFITARAVHCQPAANLSTEPAWVVGFAFLPQPAEALQVIVHVLGTLADAESDGMPGADRDTGDAHGTGTGASRRRTPRFEVTSGMTVTLDDGTVPVRLRDIGLGGFGLESAGGFSARSRHTARFEDADGLDVTIQAMAVHSRRAAADMGSERWMTGFTYIIDDTAAGEAVEAVLDRATSCLSFL